MPAPTLLSLVPRPVLFGLCGAAVGLLGAVLVGVLNPPPPPEEPPAPTPPPRLAVSVPPMVPVYPGTTNTFAVLVARGGFTGPVAVRFSGLPAWVNIDRFTFSPDNTRTEAHVVTTAATAAGTTPVTVTAEGGGATATTVFDLVVDPVPPPPPLVAIAVPAGLSVTRRGTCTFAVEVARVGFDGPVAVRFDPLPDGLSVPPVVVAAKQTRAEATLSATAAATGPVEIKVTAEATAAGQAVAATARSKVRVQTPPATPVDVVFVLDVSGGMQYAIDGTRDEIRAFVAELIRGEIDARLGVVAFRDTTLGQPNKLLKFDRDEKFTADLTLFTQELGKLTAGGGGAPGESSLDGLADAVAYPFRPGAKRVLVLITDEPPKAPDRRVKTVADAADLVTAAKIDQLHLVLPPEHKPLFAPLAKGAGGEQFNLRDAEAARDGFATLMAGLGKTVAAGVGLKPVKAETAAAPVPPVLTVVKVVPVPPPPGAPATPVLPPPEEPGVPAAEPPRGSAGVVFRFLGFVVFGAALGVGLSRVIPARRPAPPPIPLSLDDDDDELDRLPLPLDPPS